MEVDPTRVCELLVGLGDVEVLGVDDEAGEPLGVHVRGRALRPCCVACGKRLWSNGEKAGGVGGPPGVRAAGAAGVAQAPVALRAARMLVWHRHRAGPRYRAASGEADDTGRPLGHARGGPWPPAQRGRSELGCSWHPVNMSVSRWGEALLAADTARIGDTRALGLDEHLMWRRGRFRTKAWATSIVDVGRGQLLDIVRGRTAKEPTKWLLERPRQWRCSIGWAVLDLSGPYRSAFEVALPHAKQVADPFHVVRLGNDALDEVRRRVQNDTLGHRGHKHDPLYRARKLLVSASDRITDNGRFRLKGLLDAGDPKGEVRLAWHAKETLRGIYDIDDPELGAETVKQLAVEFQDLSLAPEINRLGRTLQRWHRQISNWHTAKVTNAATEAANNLAKRVKRAAFGFTNFNNYRIRALLYASKPNWELLNTLTPP